MVGITLDSGAVIGSERADRAVIVRLKEGCSSGMDLTVPTAVVPEVWRGGPRAARTAQLLAACIVEPLSEGTARKAGEVLAVVRGASAVDAIVMASAASRGDRVLTSDHDDLHRPRPLFSNVAVVRI